MPSSCHVSQVGDLLETDVIYEPNNLRAALMGEQGEGLKDGSTMHWFYRQQILCTADE